MGWTPGGHEISKLSRGDMVGEHATCTLFPRYPGADLDGGHNEQILVGIIPLADVHELCSLLSREGNI